MNSRERVELFDNKHPLNDAERIALLEMLDDHAAEQRQMCADAVIAELKSIGFQLYDIGEARIRKACLNAVEKNDGIT